MRRSLRQRRRHLHAAASIAVLLPLAACGAGGVGGVGGTFSSQSSAAWPAEVAPLIRFVEQVHGETFLHPVEIDYQSETAFDTTTRTEEALDNAMAGCEPGCFDEWAGRAAHRGAGSGTANTDGRSTEEAVLARFGLPAPAGAREEASSAGIVLGYYDPDTQRLVVRGDGRSVGQRETMVHELTHALQQQRHGAAMIAPDGEGADGAIARRSLFEADASLVQDAWTAQLDDEERDELRENYLALRDTSRHAPDTGFAAYLYEVKLFPYVFGPAYLRDVVERSSRASVAALLDHPPTSTHALLYPAAASAAARGTAPSEPRKALDADHIRLGAIAWLAVFGSALPPMSAEQAVSAWRDDEAWMEGGCAHAQLRLDADEGARQAVEEWARAANGVELTAATAADGTYTLTLRSCTDVVTPQYRSHDLIMRRRSLALALSARRFRDLTWGSCMAAALLPDELATDPSVDAVMVDERTSAAFDPSPDAAAAAAGAACDSSS